MFFLLFLHVLLFLLPTSFAQSCPNISQTSPYVIEVFGLDGVAYGYIVEKAGPLNLYRWAKIAHCEPSCVLLEVLLSGASSDTATTVPFELEFQNLYPSMTGFPLVGGNPDVGSNEDLSRGVVDYRMISGVTSSPHGTYDQSLSAYEDQPGESTIWTVKEDCQTLQVTWTNSNGQPTPFPPLFFIFEASDPEAAFIGFTNDILGVPSEFANRGVVAQVNLVLVPVSAL